MNSEYQNNYTYQTNEYPNYYYNVNYYEEPRATATPPSFNCSTYSMSPNQSTSVYNSSYSSPNTSTNHYNMYNTYNGYNSNENWNDYYNYYQYANNYQTSCYNNVYNQCYYGYNYSNDSSQCTNYENESYERQENESPVNKKQEIQKSNVMKKIYQDELEVDDEEESKSKSQKRRVRTQFTLDQRKYLLALFSQTIYPTKEQVEQASERLGVSISTVQDSDVSHYNDDEQDLIKVARYYTTNEEKIDQINSQLSNVALSDLKYRSLVFEKKALEQPKSSKVECSVCGKYFEEKGLKTHMTRMHK
ncbi:unnamed protein product [Brachionus calyciflorus]|uniref:Homeobox domain-containing protein n=1 Tax=Brachionus calyciflorus TaxID=104777 RepID=A0A813MII5_9BILA|nr:unnamed protein product [Brachionus calyciflorus]